MDIKIYAQSNVFPRIAVYDSSAPPSLLSHLVKLGFEVDIGGQPVYKSPEQPTLNPGIQWAFAVVLGIGFAGIIFRAMR